MEKRYFQPGDLGFKAFRVPDLVEGTLKKDTKETDTTGKGDPIMGMIICNDRRWPEAWRVLGLQGAEIVMCGFNTAVRSTFLVFFMLVTATKYLMVK